MRKDRKHVPANSRDVFNDLGYEIPDEFNKAIESLYYNGVSYEVCGNDRLNSLGIYVRCYYFQFAYCSGKHLLQLTYRWENVVPEDKNPLATKIAEVLNSMKDLIKLDPECEDFRFSSVMNPVLLPDGLLKVGCDFPSVCINTVQTYYDADGEPNSQSTDTQIGLVPIFESNLRMEVRYFKNAGIAVEGIETIARVVADLTQRSVMLKYEDETERLATPVGKEEAHLKYFPSQIKPSKSFRK